MEQKIVLVDQDGVLCQYDDELLKRAHERFGLPRYYRKDVAQFDTHEIFPPEFHDRVEALANEQGFFENLRPIEGAVEAFHEMSSDPRIKTFICTKPKRFAKNPYCVAEKLVWDERYLGKGMSDKAIFIRDKTLVTGSVLIDDKPTVTGSVSPSWVHVYYDQPYNRHILQPRIKDWSQWKEVLYPILFP